MVTRVKLSTISLYYLSEIFLNMAFTIPIWVSYQRSYLSFSEMSLIRTIHIFMVFILELPTGAFADIVGRRKSVALGCLISSVALILSGTATNFWSILTGFVISGIGVAFVSGAGTALLFENLKETGRIEDFAKIRSRGVFMAQIGIIIASVTSGYLWTLSKSFPYFFEATTNALTGLLYLTMSEKSRPVGVQITFVHYAQKTKDGFAQLFQSPYIKKLSLLYVIYGGITWSWQIYFNQIYATAIGFDELEKGWLFGIVRLVNALIVLFIASQRRFIKRRMLILLPIFLVVTGLVAPIRILAFDTVLILAMTAASTLRFSVMDGYINEEFDSRHRATALSALNMFVRLVYLASVAASGPILDSLFPGYMYAGLSLVAGIIIIPLGISLYTQVKKSDTAKALLVVDAPTKS